MHAILQRLITTAGCLLLCLCFVARAQTTTTVEYIHTDALGSPVAVTNEAGQVIERTQWEPYGAAIGKPAYDGPGYTGHVMDGATGLTYMQQRYYDPAIGRFLSVDPVTAHSGTGANFNRYWYANNNPYRFTDPDGRESADLTLRGVEAIQASQRRMSQEDARAGLMAASVIYGGGAAAVGSRGLAAGIRALGSMIRHKDSPRIESRTRAEPGADGGKSTITREIDRKTGDTLSTRHTVERNGKIVHQHQDHMGKSGSIRTFSDKLTGTKTVGQGKDAPTPKDVQPNFPREPAKGSRF